MGTVGIINYGVGNLYSIVNMVHKVGGKAIIINDKDSLKLVERYILPGVGAFDYGIQSLKTVKYFNYFIEQILSKQKKVLGICLGAQLMTKSSEEGELAGLSWVDGVTKKFISSPKNNIRIPHVGWETVNIINKNKLVNKISVNPRFYFTHSYYISLNNKQDIVGENHYGQKFVSVFNHKNIYGVQFHPEKSHKFGMTLINNFINL